jgi:hypothetical protein
MTNLVVKDLLENLVECVQLAEVLRLHPFAQNPEPAQVATCATCQSQHSLYHLYWQWRRYSFETLPTLGYRRQYPCRGPRRSIVRSAVAVTMGKVNKLDLVSAETLPLLAFTMGAPRTTKPRATAIGRTIRRPTKCLILPTVVSLV